MLQRISVYLYLGIFKTYEDLESVSRCWLYVMGSLCEPGSNKR